MSAREPVFNVPWSVTATLLLCAASFAWFSVSDNVEAFYALAFVPARYLEGGSEVYPGGQVARLTSFVTYAFLHGGVTHILINAVWMLAFGSAVARRIGDRRFLLFFAACAAAGAGTHLAFHFGEEAPVVGASAAIAGLMAAALRFVFSPRRRETGESRELALAPLAPLGTLMRDPRMIFVTAIWLGLNFLFGTGLVSIPGAEGPVAWEAHIGGFLYGLLFFAFFDRQQPEPDGAGATLH